MFFFVYSLGELFETWNLLELFYCSSHELLVFIFVCWRRF